jgi:hypothetical protein
MEQWNNGTMEQWNNGTMEQWNNGTIEQIPIPLHHKTEEDGRD